MKLTIKRIILGIASLACLAAVAAPASARPLRVIDDNDTVVLRGNIHPLARPEFDAGATDPTLPMERMTLVLQRSSDKQAALESLLAEQQDPASPNFHRWLAPEEFGKQFGPDSADVDAVTGWLTAHGFTVDDVAKSRAWINFSGTVSTVERAFHTRIHDYRVNGKLRHANTQDPAIPRGLADLVGGIVSLHNFPRKAMNSGIRPLATVDLQPDYTSTSGNHFLSPGDFAIIYNVNALYNAGIDGTGQSIAIVGRTHPSSTNWATFRSTMGLPANPPQVIVNGPDPGDLGANEDGEADLDVEWSGAVAKNATIKFVASKSTNTADGVDLSAQYIVNSNLAPVMSTSFGACESDMGTTENSFYKNLWQQAASQGITSFVSSGDSGASGCDSASTSSGSGRAVSGLASTPYNVAVGGTQFSDGAGGYWNATNTGYTSAIGYIPETAWNESGNVSGGTALWSTGGGVSSIYGKPSWQVSTGVPVDGKRDVPDVSLTAAGHDGYLVVTQGALSAIGGTSASSPSFAGLMALIVQKSGQRQGNANIRFYQLGNAQYGSGGAAVFHDTTSGNNSVPGVTGFSCATGYDLATGLGSVDAYALANSWISGPPTGVTLTSVTPASPQLASNTITFTAAATGGSGTYQYQLWVYNPATAAWTGSAYGASPLTWNTSGLPGGTYNIQVWARNVGSTAPYEAYTATAYTITLAPVTSVSLTSVTPAYPQLAGNTITLTAAATGGSGTYQYQLWVYNPATAAWTGSAYGASPLTWNTSGLPGGTYNIQVWARNVGSTAHYEAYTATTYVLQ